MKCFAILITLFLFQTQVFSQEIRTVKKVVSVHGNKKQVEYSYFKKRMKTIFHGPYITFDRNGKIESEENYKNGKLDGLSKFYKSGLIEREINYSDGNLEGSYKDYNNGKLVSEINYKEGSIQGKFVKYYSMGQIMIEGYKSQDHFNITKYGFDDGTYAIEQRDSSRDYYNLYSSSGNLIISTRDTAKQFDRREWCNCPKVQSTSYKYPAILAELGLEGIVILRLLVGTDGKLKGIETIKGFHKDAITAAIQSIKRISCYGIAIKNNIPLEYHLIQTINFRLIDNDSYSGMNYELRYDCGK